MTSVTTTMSGKSGRFPDATRVIAGFLATTEKRALIWMAKRLPARVNADHLTALGLVAMVMAGLSFVLARWYPVGLALVVFWLAVNWFGDSLDGTVARVRNHQRPRYGFYVDHVVDAFGTLCLVGGMALSGYMSPLVGLGLLLVYFMLSIEAYLATYARGVFRLSFWGFGPTELRIILAIGSIRLMVSPTATLFGHRFLLFDVGAVVAIVCMAATLVAAVVKNTRALYREEPLPRYAGTRGQDDAGK
jgi:archaetidylinositol phosphate synthase